MKLTDSQLELLIKRLRVKPPCPNCGSFENQSVQSDEYQLTSMNRTEDSYTIGGEMGFMPLAVCICPSCGYTRMFNLKVLGIVTQ